MTLKNPNANTRIIVAYADGKPETVDITGAGDDAIVDLLMQVFRSVESSDPTAHPTTHTTLGMVIGPERTAALWERAAAQFAPARKPSAPPRPGPFVRWNAARWDVYADDAPDSTRIGTVYRADPPDGIAMTTFCGYHDGPPVQCVADVPTLPDAARAVFDAHRMTLA